MPKSSRIVATGAAIVAVAAGAYTGWPRAAQAEPLPGDQRPPTLAAPPRATFAEGTDTTPPVVLDAPVLFAPGQRLHVEVPVRTAARRDLLRITAAFRTADGHPAGDQVFTARLTGGAWRTVPFELDIPDRAVSVELNWVPVVGPVEVDAPSVTTITSSAQQPPGHV